MAEPRNSPSQKKPVGRKKVYVVRGEAGQKYRFEDPTKALEFKTKLRSQSLPVDTLKEAGVSESSRPAIRYGEKRSMISKVPYTVGSPLRTADSTALAMQQAELASKKRDLQKPIDNLADVNYLKNEVARLGRIPEGKRSPRQQEQLDTNLQTLRSMSPREPSDPDLEDVNTIIDITGGLTKTEKDPITGLDTRIIQEGSSQARAGQDVISNRTTSFNSRKWARNLQPYGVASGNAALRAHSENAKIFNQIKAEMENGTLPFSRNEAGRAAFIKEADKRMKAKTGIPYDVYDQMRKDFPNQ
jgi:hypothetical protein